MPNETQDAKAFTLATINLPCFLHDRPRSLVDHCKSRISSAEEITSSNIEILSDSSFKFQTSKGAK